MGDKRLRAAEVGLRASPIDRFLDAVERLPVPYWLVYLLVFSLEVTLFHLIAWQDGWVARFRLEPLNFLFPLWTWGPLLAMTYLNGVALQSLRAFAPLLEDDREALSRLEVEFTCMPAGPVFVTGLIWLMIYGALILVSFESFIQLYPLGTLATGVSLITGLITFPIGGVLYYHTIRQLRLVSQTLKRVRQFNLFQLDPVYAFSRLTSQTGLIWLVMLTLSQLLFPARLLTPVWLSLYAAQAVLVFAAFVLPLWNVHQRLEAEKHRLLSESNQRLENKLQHMHRSLDVDHLDDLEVIQHALGSLAAEREFLTKIPTWPWRTSTLRGFLSALVLPVLLVLLQIFLERIFR